jgi:hypothetical protein
MAVPFEILKDALNRLVVIVPPLTNFTPTTLIVGENLVLSDETKALELGTLPRTWAHHLMNANDVFILYKGKGLLPEPVRVVLNISGQ